jgi:DNA transposition AAA+ family ATPase
MDTVESAKYKSIIKNSISKAITTCGSQTKLAVKAGVSQGAIGKYLRGHAMPTGITAKNLSKAVGNQPPSDFAPHIFGD